MASSSSTPSTQQPFLRSAWLIHAADVIGDRRHASVQALTQAIGPLVKTRGRLESANAGTLAQVAMGLQQREMEKLSDGTAAPPLVQLDPAQWPEGLPEDLQAFKSSLAPMHIRVVSNTLNHREAIASISDLGSGSSGSSGSGDDDWSLVVEDDALFTEEMAAQLQNTIRDAPTDADIIMLGLPTALSPEKGKVVFEEPLARFSSVPACESYLVRTRAAKRMAPAFLPVRFAANVQLSFVARLQGVKVYACVPNIFVDGTKLGVFCSTLEVNNRLLWNQPVCQMEALLRSSDAYTPPHVVTATQMADGAWSNQPFKNHPDALVLRAEHMARIGRPTDAEAYYATAYAEYLKSDCLLTNASQFLRRYTALYQQLQEDIPAPAPPPDDAVAR
jgi:hypothetical protein